MVSIHYAAADLLRVLTEAAEAVRSEPRDASLIAALRAWLREGIDGAAAPKEVSR